MIIRSSFKCGTCGFPHTVRIGMGQGVYQEHVFSCRNCNEDIKIGMKVDYKNISTETLALENAEHCPEEKDAAVVNVDANFTVPANMTDADVSFHRMYQMQEMMEAAEKKGPLPTFTMEQLMSGARPYRRPDHQDEWLKLRKVISLRRSGKDKLVAQKMLEATKEYYPKEPISTVEDWMWRLTMQLCRPRFEPAFKGIMDEISAIVKTANMGDFWKHYSENMREDRTKLYFEILKDYFDGYSDFSQVSYRLSAGLDIPDDHVVTSVGFDSVKTFYGDAYETFAKSVEILALLNNIKMGRKFDQFERLTLKEYQKLDNSSKFNCFSLNAPFIAICGEKDNQIRNASHHRDINISADKSLVTYRAGKGGTGEERSMLYSAYLVKSTNIFLQIMTLLRVEIAICHLSKQKPPV